MPILSIAVNKTGTLAVQEAVARRLRETGPMPPPGVIFQAVAPTDHGYQVIGLWDSLSSLARFRDERLAPALDAEGIADDLSLSTYEATSYILGARPEAANEVATGA
jgi:hypothetical protein